MTIAEKFEQIENLKGKIDVLGPGKDWDDAFFRKVKIDFTYTSNKLMAILSITFVLQIN